MRALDLFCGACGGWSVGLHENGIETVAACEIDPWRRETFSRNFPKARMYDDVRTLTADRLRSDLGFLPDITVGSPPCQDASTANSKGKGVDGERTGLFFDAVRLVSEVRPVWAGFENVPGLRTRGYDRVHDALEAVGYTVWPLVVGAWRAGAPHRRNRVWIVALANEVREPRGAVNAQMGRWLGQHAHAPGHWQDWNGGPPDLGRVDDGLPKGMARKMISAYGDAVVPAVTTAVIRAIQTARAACLTSPPDA